MKTKLLAPRNSHIFGNFKVLIPNKNHGNKSPRKPIKDGTQTGKKK